MKENILKVKTLQYWVNKKHYLACYQSKSKPVLSDDSSNI